MNLDEAIREFHDYNVVDFRLCRSPISSTIYKGLNLLSFGKLKEKPYDTLYHLWALVSLERDGLVVKIRLEKVERIRITVVNITEDTCYQSLPCIVAGDTTFTELINNGYNESINKGIKWQKYDARTANCQLFIMTILNGNGIVARCDSSYYEWSLPLQNEVVRPYEGEAALIKAIDTNNSDKQTNHEQRQKLGESQRGFNIPSNITHDKIQQQDILDPERKGTDTIIIEVNGGQFYKRKFKAGNINDFFKSGQAQQCALEWVVQDLDDLLWEPLWKLSKYSADFASFGEDIYADDIIPSLTKYLPLIGVK